MQPFVIVTGTVLLVRICEIRLIARHDRGWLEAHHQVESIDHVGAEPRIPCGLVIAKVAAQQSVQPVFIKRHDGGIAAKPDVLQSRAMTEKCGAEKILRL